MELVKNLKIHLNLITEWPADKKAATITKANQSYAKEVARISV